MTKEELVRLMEGGEEVMLVDVREADEFAAGPNMEGAENVPMGKMFVMAGKGELPKDKKIVTICKSGGRCAIVAKELKNKGFDIDYLEGGISAVA